MADSTTVVEQYAAGTPNVPSVEIYNTRAAADGGDIYLIPDGLRRGVSVVLQVSSGSGKIQYSTSPRYLFKNANTLSSVVWVDWSNGVVAVNTQNQFGPISAIRINNTSGSQTMHVQGD